MIHSFIHRWKTTVLLTGLLMAGLTVFSTLSPANANTTPPPSDNQTSTTPSTSPLSYPQYGEWRYNPYSNPPTLMWWNERMPMVPVLYISFLPNQMILNAVTPVWPDTGIIFYIKDKSEKLGLNLTLLRKTDKNCFYQAIIYGAKDQQDFINDMVSSRKARLITPSSYSQSLSLKHVNEAMAAIISTHPELHFTLPTDLKKHQ